jgi:DNA-binding IclR family transcriptional regulator
MFRPVSQVILLALLNTCQKLPVSQLRWFAGLEAPTFNRGLAALLEHGVVHQQQGTCSLAQEISNMARREGAVN